MSKIFNSLFLFNYHIEQNEYSLHQDYKLFFINFKHRNKLSVNSRKFISHWSNSLNLIFNVFYYNLNPLFYGSFIFKKEILAFNWHNFKNSIFLWTKLNAFFVLKTNKFSSRFDFFYKKLQLSGFNFIFVTDCYYHFKNLYYFKKFQFFTIGLVPSNVNPWLVSYALPSFTNNFLTQSFFINLCFILKKHSYKIKFNFYQNLWFNNLLK